MAECMLTARSHGIKNNINLLPNWYYKFPINQKEQITYSSLGTTIDCVVKTAGDVSFEITDDGLKITGGPSGYFHHYADMNLIKLAGQPITFSIFDSNNKLYTITRQIPNSGSWIVGYIVTDGGIRFELVIHEGFYGYQSYAGPNTQDIIEAVKFELGPESTLCRNYNGNLIINDSPYNYQQELMKCQRYLQPIELLCIKNICKYTYNGEYIIAFGSYMFPTQMRSAPTAINTEDVWISYQIYNTWYKPKSVSINCDKCCYSISVTVEEDIYKNHDEFFLWSGKIAGVSSPIWIASEL